MSGKLYLPAVLHLLRVHAGILCEQTHQKKFERFCQQRFARASTSIFLKLSPRIPRLIRGSL